jgi:cAMP-binding proteins - catabolite gene activator and regulatory subunit of cAMP-dependent protein kinases
MNSCEGRAWYETRKKAPVRSQSISVESERGASHFRLSEGSKRLHAGRTRGFCFLHSERQGQEDVISEQGKEAVVALLGTGDFFGEGCLTGQLRLSTVSAMTECVIVRIAKADITA